jgi:hypothetical protein
LSAKTRKSRLRAAFFICTKALSGDIIKTYVKSLVKMKKIATVGGTCDSWVNPLHIASNRLVRTRYDESIFGAHDTVARSGPPSRRDTKTKFDCLESMGMKHPSLSL